MQYSFQIKITVNCKNQGSLHDLNGSRWNEKKEETNKQTFLNRDGVKIPKKKKKKTLKKKKKKEKKIKKKKNRKKKKKNKKTKINK